MKTLHILALSTVLALSTTSLRAASPDTYQVTGAIVELTDTKIVVMKGTERFEIARTKDSKVTGDLKIGTKVTIEYSMTAKSIEAKAK